MTCQAPHPSFDMVVTFKDGSAFPARRESDGYVIVDLRLFPLASTDQMLRLGWYPDQLPASVPEAFIANAETSEPKGFACFRP